MGNSRKRLILIELNEINFDVVEKYVAADAGRFPALKKLLNGARIRTTSEEKYEQLEPWIQWPSVHTGCTFAEHGIFRLGDVVGTKAPQIFEQLEQAGCKIGVISAMNAENRLSKPAYFVPDPWTQTPPDGSWWSRALTEAVSQTVNDNSQARITPKSALQLVLALARFARPSHYILQLVLSSRQKPWLKPLVLDLLLHDVHWSFFNAKRPDFSTLFLNAGAHIQHHYFFNAEPLRGELTKKNPHWYVKASDDPVADVLGLYDLIVGEYFSRTDTEIILATGLSQKPYDSLKFYYRLNAHADFLHSLGIDFAGVYPRMTRDFLIEFDTEVQARKAQEVLANVQVKEDGCTLFGEIDNRGKSLFVTLTYPEEITESTEYVFGGSAQPLKPLVSFVAIKNGMHQAQGFAFFTHGIEAHAPKDMAHVSSIGKSILNYFGVHG
jgi:hypothetical protein